MFDIQTTKPFIVPINDLQRSLKVTGNSWLVGWCLTALSAQKRYIVPCENLKQNC